MRIGLRRSLLLVQLVIAAMVFSAVVVVDAAIANIPSVVGDLQVETVTNPIGVTTTTPRLSWRATSSPAGASQARAEVRVATTAAALTGGTPLWSSTLTTSNAIVWW